MSPNGPHTGPTIGVLAAMEEPPMSGTKTGSTTGPHAVDRSAGTGMTGQPMLMSAAIAHAPPAGNQISMILNLPPSGTIIRMLMVWTYGSGPT